MVDIDQLTEIQHEALLKVFDRMPLYLYDKMPWGKPRGLAPEEPITFHQFLENAYTSRDNVIMVPWCGMWLGVEPDGYVHS